MTNKNKSRATLGSLLGAMLLFTIASSTFAQTTTNSTSTDNTSSTSTNNNTVSNTGNNTRNTANGTTTNENTTGGGSSGSGSTFSATSDQVLLLSAENLHKGSTGQQVTVLQGLLAELGFLDLTSIGGPTGYFGNLTRDALARYQAAIGVPSTGNFGPMTRNSMALHFVRNNWLNNLAGINTNGMTGAASIGNSAANTGGSDLSVTSEFGIFSATNPGNYFNGVWYPNSVDTNIRTTDTGNTETTY
jgi:peptidoglycan hydrolase-like protein with peptidoglycan-binding domain